MESSPPRPAWLQAMRHPLGSLLYSIRFRMLLLVTVSVVVPSAVVGGYAQLHLNELATKGATQELKAAAEQVRKELSLPLGAARDSLTGIRATLILRESADALARGREGAPRGKALRDLDKFFSYLLEGESPLEAVALLDDSGRVLYQRPKGAFAASALPVPAGGGARIITDPTSPQAPRLLAVQALEPTGSGARLMVVGRLLPDRLDPVLERASVPGQLAYLIDETGRILLGPPAGASLPRDTAEELTADEATMVEFLGAKGGDVLGVTLPTEVEGVHLVIEKGRGQDQLLLEGFTRRMLWTVLAFAVGLLALGLLMARTIVLPLEAMLGAAKEIKEGHGLGRRVEVRGGGELRELGDAFNLMSKSLREVMEELRANSEEFKRLSNTDPLTGRHNRRYILDTLQRDLRRAKRFGQPLSLIMVDIDHFKDYNDRWGHMAGDEALRGIAAALSANVRDSDVLARFGGEEFLVSLPQTDKPGALFAAEKLRGAVEELVFQPRDAKVRLTVSLGVATYEEDGRTIDEVIEAADQALYRAKEGGRNRVVSFNAPSPPGPTPSPRSRP